MKTGDPVEYLRLRTKGSSDDMVSIPRSVIVGVLDELDSEVKRRETSEYSLIEAEHYIEKIL